MGAVTRSQVAGWDAHALSTVATIVSPTVQRIDDSADKMRSSIDGLHWSGTARGAADDRADRENQQMRKVGSAFDDLAAACTAGARAMEPMIAGLTRTASNLESDNFDVAEDWTVTDKHNYTAAIAACGENAQAQNQVRQLRKQRGDEAATSTVSLQRLAVALGTADQNCADAIVAANAKIGSLAPVAASLNGTIAGKDLADFTSGTATPDELARLHAATQLTDEQKADLAGGKPVDLTQGQFDYLRQMMRAQDGMSVQDIDKMTSALPQGNQGDLANAMQLVSSPNVHTASVLTAGAVPTVADHGGMSQLPSQVRTLLTDNPVSVKTNWTAAGTFMTADISRSGDFKALTNIMGRGDQSLAQGSDVDRGLLKQGAEIAGATGSPNVTMTMDGRGVHDSEVGSLADKMLGAGGHDAQAVHDFVTGNNMASTVDRGGSYNASDHALEVLQHKWDPGQHGAANMFTSIGAAAGQPVDSFVNQQGGESASALAQIIAQHSDTLSQNMPGHGYDSLGQVNPELTQSIANSMRPYLGNFANVTDNHGAEHILANQSAQPFDTVKDLSHLFNVLDSDPKAARIINDGGQQWIDYLQYQGGIDPTHVDYALRAGQLNHAMQQGLTDQIGQLTARDQWDQVQSYNKQTAWIDTAATAAWLAPTPAVGVMAGVTDIWLKQDLVAPGDPQHPAAAGPTQAAVSAVGNDFKTDRVRTTFDQAQGHLHAHPEATTNFPGFVQNGQLDWSAVTESPATSNNFLQQADAVGGIGDVKFNSLFTDGMSSENIVEPRSGPTDLEQQPR